MSLPGNVSIALYAVFASRYNIPPSDAYVLPAVFERAASLLKITPIKLLTEAVNYNRPLGDELARVAKKVADLQNKETN